MKYLKNTSPLFALALILLGIYQFNLFNSKVPHLDKEILITPLKNIHSPHDYIEAIQAKKIYDVQPVRDLSHLLDIWIYKKTGVFVALFHNLILFILSLIFIYKLMNFYYEKRINLILISIYAVHPVFTSIILVETSRKHLLSFLFTVIFLYLIKQYDLQGIKNKILSYLFYFISCFSQPINLGSPSYILFKDKIYKEKIKENIKQMFPFGGICLVVILINLFYYNFSFVEQTGILKQSGINLGESVLALGRMAFQFFVPYSYSIFYHRGGVSNIIGMYLYVIILFYAWKTCRKEIFLPFFFLYFSVIFILYHKQTNIFYFDTYILTPSLFFLVIVGESLRKIKKTKFLYILLAVVFIGLIGKSIKEVKSRDNFYVFLEEKFLDEPACEMYQTYLSVLYLRKELNKMKSIGEMWVNEECFYYNKNTYLNHVYYLSLLVYFNDQLTLEEKEKLFRQKENEGNNIKVFTELVRLRGKKDGAARNLLNLLQGFKKKEKGLCFSIEMDHIVNDINRYCLDEIRDCKEVKKFISENEC